MSPSHLFLTRHSFSFSSCLLEAHLDFPFLSPPERDVGLGPGREMLFLQSRDVNKVQTEMLHKHYIYLIHSLLNLQLYDWRISTWFKRLNQSHQVWKKKPTTIKQQKQAGSGYFWPVQRDAPCWMFAKWSHFYNCIVPLSFKKKTSSVVCFSLQTSKSFTRGSIMQKRSSVRPWLICL